MVIALKSFTEITCELVPMHSLPKIVKYCRGGGGEGGISSKVVQDTQSTSRRLPRDFEKIFDPRRGVKFLTTNTKN